MSEGRVDRAKKGKSKRKGERGGFTGGGRITGGDESVPALTLLQGVKKGKGKSVD